MEMNEKLTIFWQLGVILSDSFDPWSLPRG